MTYLLDANILISAHRHYYAFDICHAWLIAHAQATGATVVTHEKHEPQSRKRVPIPNVCEAHDIPYITTFDLLRRLNITFH